MSPHRPDPAASTRRPPGSLRRRPDRLAAGVVVAVAAGVVVATIAVAGGPAPVAGAVGAGAPAADAIGTIAGGPTTITPALDTGLAPRGVAVRPAGIYVSDEESNVVRRVGRAAGDQVLIVGNGALGFGGDGGPAADAMLSRPRGLAFDAAGNLYIADTNNNRVRKVTPGGTITTAAGNGGAGTTGDGGPATAAQVGYPSDVAVDGAGNLFIADYGNHQVRKVDTGGTITTVAGTGTYGASGDGGPATAATFGSPEGLAVTAAGEVFIADTGNYRIRKVDTGGTVTTVAGTGSYGHSGDGGPATAAEIATVRDIDVDGAGNLLLTETGYSDVRRIDTGGTITTVAGNAGSGFYGDGGPATSAALNSPSGVAFDGGAFVIADRDNRRVRRVAGGTISSIAGNGEETFVADGGIATATPTAPRDLAADAAGNVYVADTGNNRVRRIATDGTISTVAGTGDGGFSGDGGPATAATLWSPEDVAVDGAGNLFIADGANQRIRRVDTSGTITTVAGSTYGFSGDGGPATSAQMRYPSGVAVDGAGNLFIVDTYNYRVRRVTAGGTMSTVAGTGTSGYSGDGGAATSAQIGSVGGLAADELGNVFIADLTNNRIRRIGVGGTITTVAGNGSAGFSGDGGPATSAQMAPGDVSVSGGVLTVADTYNNRIRRVSVGGTISTIAGDGTQAFGGDGGDATAAQISFPSGVAVDGAGRVSVTGGDRRVRRIEARAGGSRLVPLAPTRIVDSRDGTGFAGPLGAGATATIPVAGIGPVPSGATAVELNVTVTGATAPSYLTLFPAGGSVPTAASVLFAAGETVSNHVTVRIGGGGGVSVFNQLGSVEVVADLVGYYDDGSADTGLFAAGAPVRMLDSRTGVGFAGPVGPGASSRLVVAGTGVVPANATAALFNVTVTEATAPSYLTLYPTGTGVPTAASVLFGAGQTRANLVAVPLGAGGAVEVFNQLGEVQVIADLVGWFDETGSGAGFHPLTPTRFLDTRTANGLPGPLTEGAEGHLKVAARLGVPATATGMAGNLTATGGTAASYLAVYPDQSANPGTANLLFGAGQTIPNGVVSRIGPNQRVTVYNQLGTTDAVLDLAGYFDR